MEELALNILDIACNSVRAKASLIRIDVTADTKKDVLQISVSDNGKGMSEEFLKTVTDPFATTRTTRKVGMGIPLFKMAAESADGAFSITSKVGVGTTTKASFALSHIDRMPLGDVAGTMVALIGQAEKADIVLTYSVDEREYVFDTRDVKRILDGVDINSTEIIVYLKEMIDENITNINGGLII